jgi:hypothetical protein
MSESFSTFRARYHGLAAPALPLEGHYRGELVGPAWFRRLASHVLGIGGLRGWWGKEFDGKGSAVNLVERDGQLARVLPMRVKVTASRATGATTVTLTYPASSPLPWRYVVDELREVEVGGVLLGLSGIALAKNRRLNLPFMLHPQCCEGEVVR